MSSFLVLSFLQRIENLIIHISFEMSFSNTKCGNLFPGISMVYSSRNSNAYYLCNKYIKLKFASKFLLNNYALLSMLLLTYIFIAVNTFIVNSIRSIYPDLAHIYTYLTRYFKHSKYLSHR